jgi:hypothetical protein
MSIEQHMYIERYVYEAGLDISLGTDDLSFDYEYCKNLTEFASLNGAILLAEGGMGKTTFIGKLKTHFGDDVELIELAYYNKDPQGLREKINKASPSNIIIDGIDEAPGAHGVLELELKKLNGKKIWLVSREIDVIENLEKLPNLKKYFLAPYTQDDVRQIANQKGLAADQIVDIFKEKGILSLCANPIGCNFAIEAYKTDPDNITQSSMWVNGIKELCNENRSSSKNVIDPSQYSYDQIMDCAAWIAVCMALTDNNAVSVGKSPKALFLEDLVFLDKNFTKDMIRATLNRALFSSDYDHLYHFSHNTYYDYLAAYWLYKYFHPKQYSNLLFAPGKTVAPKHEGMVGWLVNMDNQLSEYSKYIVEHYPELIMRREDAINRFDKLDICKILMERTGDMDFMFHDYNCSFLKCKELAEFLLPYLSGSKNQQELTMRIIRWCKINELAGQMVDIALDGSNDHFLRVRALQALTALDNNEQKARVKEIFPISDDNHMQLIGYVLSCAWPYITIDELLSHIIEQDESFIGQYYFFLKQIVPKNISSIVNKNNAPAVLHWCMDKFKEIKEHCKSSYIFPDFVKLMHTYCWNWVEYNTVTPLLADIYIKYRDYDIFLEPSNFNNDPQNNIALSIDSFKKNQKGRITVLKHVIDNYPSEDIIFLSYNRYSLYSKVDIQCLLNILSNEATAHKEIWAQCLIEVLGKNDVEDFDKLIKLNPEYKTMIYEKLQSIERREAYNRERELREKDKQDEREKKEADYYETVCEYLNNNQSPIDFRDIILKEYNLQSNHNLTKSRLWEKLDTPQRDKLLKLAWQYITTETGITVDDEIITNISYTLLFIEKEPFPDKAWEVSGERLIKSGSCFSNNEFLPQIYNLFIKAKPDIVLNYLINTPEDITNWSGMFDENQASQLLVGNDHPLILFEMEKHHPDLVFNHLKQKNIDNIKPTQIDFNYLLMTKLSNGYNEYTTNILKRLQTGDGRDWLEKHIWDLYQILVSDMLFIKSLENASSKILADIIDWMEDNFPSHAKPKHNGSYTPSAIDEIYQAKYIFVDWLINRGEADLMFKLKEKYPKVYDFQYFRAERVRREKEAPVFTVAELKELSLSKKCCAVKTPEHLLILLMEKLKEYELYLHGDTPAINELWDVSQLPKHRDENNLSDRIKIFLESRIKGIVVNREVEIRRKQKGGEESGSKTDLWVQAITANGKDTITLCVEVKGSWNPEAKTALNNQLIGKYMREKAKAGILLLGWFEPNEGNIWKDIETARKELEQQVNKARKNHHLVSAIVIDCRIK